MRHAVALGARAREEEGQSLAEFALIVPVFLLVLMGLTEFAFAFNAMLNTNYASRGAGLIAAQVGNSNAANCLILNEVEQMTNSPAERSQITRVDIQRTNPSGSTVYAADTYTRTGSTTCTLSNGTTLTVPYRATTNGYPPSQRCTVLPPNGCPTLTPLRTTVDTIAVQITYVYPWHTPLRALMGIFNGSLSGTGYTFVQRNAFRMEPTL
jgi:Flp pilus assembly protein TadG